MKMSLARVQGIGKISMRRAMRKKKRTRARIRPARKTLSGKSTESPSRRIRLRVVLTLRPDGNYIDTVGRNASGLIIKGVIDVSK